MNHKRIENVFLICLMLGIYTVFVSNTGTGISLPVPVFLHICNALVVESHICFWNCCTEIFARHIMLILFCFCGDPFLLWLVLKSLYAYITDKDLRLRTWEKAGMYIFLVVLFVFFVYRNLP